MNNNSKVSELLTQIRNGSLSGRKFVYCSKTLFNCKILEILINEGFIRNYIVKGKFLKIFLKYIYGIKPVIKTICLVSKPSNRVYIRSKNIWRIKPGLGLFLITTTDGLKTHKEAKNMCLGGEVICFIN